MTPWFLFLCFFVPYNKCPGAYFFFFFFLPKVLYSISLPSKGALLSEHCLLLRSPCASGANDASRLDGHKAHYGVPIDEYKRNLRWIADQYVRGPEGPVIVICTPPPIDESRRLHLTTAIKGMPSELLDRSAARTEKYALAAVEVAEEMDVALADLHGGLKGHGGKDWAKRLLSDGLHFTQEGQELVHDIVDDVVRNWRVKTKSPAAGDDDTGGRTSPSSLGIGSSSLRAHSAVLRWETPGHEELVGANNTDEWKPGAGGSRGGDRQTADSI